MTPSLTTEGFTAASCTKASRHALRREWRFEMSALMLPKVTTEVWGREQVWRSDTLRPGNTAQEQNAIQCSAVQCS